MPPTVLTLLKVGYFVIYKCCQKHRLNDKYSQTVAIELKINLSKQREMAPLNAHSCNFEARRSNSDLLTVGKHQF